MKSNIEWTPLKGNDLPLEEAILVAHAHGIEYIIFHTAAWRWVYRGDLVPPMVLKSITHFCVPEKPE